MLSYALALEYRKRLPGPHFLVAPFVKTHIEGAHQELQGFRKKHQSMAKRSWRMKIGS
jgi:hypothetical protein